jgi:urease accessory protein
MSFDLNAPELAPYLDEPPQLPSGALGKNAFLRLRFERRDERSILAFMDRNAPLLVQRALYCDEGMPTLPVVFIITNSGGILQGDRYRIEIEVASEAFAHVTTQAATKIHEMDANHASQFQQITLHDHAYLEYIPDLVIPFRNARFLTRTQINLAPTATLLYSEILMGGRLHYGGGESFAFDLFSSEVSAMSDRGHGLFVEKFVIEPARSPVTTSGVMGEFQVFGNAILLTPREHADKLYPRLPAEWCLDTGFAAGASRLPNDAGLVYKVVGRNSAVVRRKIRGFWGLVRAEVLGRKVPTAFSWS